MESMELSTPRASVSVKFHPEFEILKKIFIFDKFWEIWNDFTKNKRYLTRVPTLYIKRDKIFVCYWSHPHLSSSAWMRLNEDSISRKVKSLCFWIITEIDKSLMPQQSNAKKKLAKTLKITELNKLMQRQANE